MSIEELEKQKKLVIKYSVITFIGLFLASSFCFFINQMWIPLGFILGGIIAIINFIILYEFSYYVTRNNANSKKLSFFLYISRMLLYVLGFVICLLLQYTFNLKIFFWGTCFASYIINIIIMTLVMGRSEKKTKK